MYIILDYSDHDFRILGFQDVIHVMHSPPQLLSASQMCLIPLLNNQLTFKENGQSAGKD